jgi:hypothetical protein
MVMPRDADDGQIDTVGVLLSGRRMLCLALFALGYAVGAVGAVWATAWCGAGVVQLMMPEPPRRDQHD